MAGKTVTAQDSGCPHGRSAPDICEDCALQAATGDPDALAARQDHSTVKADQAAAQES